jgi:PAS domain-containing protein
MSTARKLVEVSNATYSPEKMTERLATIDRTQAVLEFSENGKILAANERLLNILNYTDVEIKVKSLSDLCKDKLTWSDPKDFEPREIILQSKGSRPRYLMGSIGRVQENENISNFIFSGFDITEIREELEIKTPLFQESCRLRVFKIISGRDLKINWNHVKNTQKS